MQSLNSLIADSLDSEAASSEYLWQVITQRASAERPKRTYWTRILASFAALTIGTFGLVSITGATDASGLPSTDFDVSLAPNLEAMLEPRPMSQDDLARYEMKSAFQPIKAIVFCRSTPYGSASVGPAANFYLTREDVDALNTSSIIRRCIQGSYSTNTYAERFAEAKILADVETRTPDLFAICVTEVDPTAITVLPGYIGVQNPNQLCQSNAMHPMSLDGESRAAVETRSQSEYLQWLNRHQNFPMNYGDGFSTFSVDDWTRFLILRTEGVSG